MKEERISWVSLPLGRRERWLPCRDTPAREASLGVATALGLGKGCSNTSVYEEQRIPYERALHRMGWTQPPRELPVGVCG